MAVASSVASAAAQKAAEQLRIEGMKKGKTPEQKRVIDFFFNVGENKGCGCGGCLSKSSSNLTMDEYMKLVQDKCNMLDSKNKAIAKIGLDESEIQEIAPIMLASFVYDDDVLIKAENHIAVSSQYAITWIFFSATQIYTYKYIFDTTSDNTWEITNDFFYTDVTCLTTVRSLKEKIDINITKGCLSSGENTVKNNYIVDTFEIIVPGTSYSFSMRNNDTFEQSLQAAKAMLREKKFTK